MSVVLFPPPHLAPAVPEAAYGCAWLTALGAVATAEVVVAWTGRDAVIKWPNDVRVDRRKIAGILVERAPAPRQPATSSADVPVVEPACGAIIGIGLNANLNEEDFSPEVAANATSLQILRGGAPVDRSILTRDLIRRLDYWYGVGRSCGIGTLNGLWRARSEHLGRLVRVATPCATLVGRLIDLDLRFGVTMLIGAGVDPESSDYDAPPLTRLPLADVLALETIADGLNKHEHVSN